jgi:hypothetical protein
LRQKKEKNRTARKQLPQLLTQSALSSAFIVKYTYRRTRIWLGSRFNDHRQFKLKFDDEDRVFEISVACGLIKDINGYHIHV